MLVPYIWLVDDHIAIHSRSLVCACPTGLAPTAPFTACLAPPVPVTRMCANAAMAFMVPAANKFAQVPLLVVFATATVLASAVARVSAMRIGTAMPLAVSVPQAGSARIAPLPTTLYQCRLRLLRLPFQAQVKSPRLMGLALCSSHLAPFTCCSAMMVGLKSSAC